MQASSSRGVKGLGEIVVRPGIEPCHTVLQLGLGGKHQNRGTTVTSPHLSGHLIAVQLGHHHVQNQQIVDAQQGVVRPSLSIMHRLHLKPLLLQQLLERRGQQFIIFHN